MRKAGPASEANVIYIMSLLESEGTKDEVASEAPLAAKGTAFCHFGWPKNTFLRQRKASSTASKAHLLASLRQFCARKGEKGKGKGKSKASEARRLCVDFILSQGGG